MVFQVISEITCSRTIFISEQTWEPPVRSQKRRGDRAHPPFVSAAVTTTVEVQVPVLKVQLKSSLQHVAGLDLPLK